MPHVLFQLLPAAIIIGMLCVLLRCKTGSSSDLNTYLLSDAQAGFLVCPGCEFENFTRFSYCNLCGERLIDKTNDASAKEQQTETPIHARKLRTQQIRVRKRKEWMRKVGVDGNLFWFRGNDNSTISSTMRSVSAAQSPGFVLQYTTEYAKNAPPEEGGVEMVEPGVIQMDDGVTMTLVPSTEATPARFPVGETLPFSAEHMDEIITLSATDFPSKYAHFVVSTAALLVPADVAFIKLSIHRDQLLEESVDHVGCIKEKNIHSYMRINFMDESGVDAGGIHREWFMLVNELLVNPTLQLFTCCNNSDQSYYLNPAAKYDLGADNLTYYYATGRLIGRALLEGCTWGFHLALPLLKTILGIPVTFSDLEYLDPEAYRSMVWLMENNGVDDLGLDFSVMESRGGELVQVELIPNGSNITVTDANKHTYLKRKFEYLLFESVSDQLFMLLKGIYEVIPQELLLLFDAEELDYLLCGTQEIDVDDWKANTVCSTNLKWTSVLEWFWEVVAEMPNEYRRRLLQFATGSSRVPLSGFAGLTSYDGRLCPFTLKSTSSCRMKYISSHACFNRLDIPTYRSKKELKTFLYATLETELTGFTTA
uniref:HECT-type E3 ubiquitin transferase n=1 Tax=Globisporangium ultimum (strain ATCC 200006 / CBS 805.95 / DAOM BR144) TaxID=431595 RepID=K3X445_GLOUD